MGAMTKLSKFRFSTRKTDDIKIRINSHSDKVIIWGLVFVSCWLYFNLSNKDMTDFIYLCSLLWYLIVLLYICRIRIFSGLGIYICYFFCYVQSGMLMQGYYSYHTVFDIRTILAVIIYNIVSPFFLLFVLPFLKVKTTEIKMYEIKSEWIISLFLTGVFSMLVYYISVGAIPLFVEDAENFRVQAMAGRGFLVVIASISFEVSLVLSKKNSHRSMILIIGIAMLIGTGYRSSALTLMLLWFLVFWVGKGKKFLFQGVLMLVVLCFFYALTGVIRNGVGWRVSKLYTVVLWRFYVNTSNIDVIVKNYPTDKFQYGLTLLNDISVILPGAQQTYMTKIKAIMNYQFSGGSLTPTPFGEGYYNWGIMGMILWPIVTLVFVAYLDNFNKNKFAGGMYFLVSFGLTGLATSSFIPPLVNVYIPAMLVYIVLKYINSHYGLKFRR